MKCKTPLIKRVKDQSVPIECGKCPDCIKKKTSQWSFRLRKEGDDSSSSYFITLTYDTEHVPISNNGYMTLNPDDVTLWLKRLRKISYDIITKPDRTKQKQYRTIKYYYVGEYGSINNRPHYHMIIFNAKVEDIEKTWNYGAVHYGTVTGASIGYTLKYMIKDGRIPMHKNDDRLPEFGRMSKQLGIGYLTAETMYWHTDKRALLQRLCCIIDGKKVPMPRYYKERIYDNVHKHLIKESAIKQEKINLQIREQTINIAGEIEAHKAQWDKMKASKYKNKHI